MQPLPLTLMRLPHISSISFMISGVAPCASCPVRNPVLVLTKSALACIAHSQAFLTSSTVRASYTVSSNRGRHEQGFSGIALELYVYGLKRRRHLPSPYPDNFSTARRWLPLCNSLNDNIYSRSSDSCYRRQSGSAPFHWSWHKFPVPCGRLYYPSWRSRTFRAIKMFCRSCYKKIIDISRKQDII